MKARVAGAVLTMVVASLLVASPALASSRHGVASSRVVAQASPCAIGEICDVPTNESGSVNTTPLAKPKDPAGATVRSILVLAALFAGFGFYLRWALKRGTVY